MPRLGTPYALICSTLCKHFCRSPGGTRPLARLWVCLMWPQVCLCTPYAPPMHRGKVRTQARQAARYAPHSPTASHNATSLEACTSRARLDPPHRRAASSRDMISSTSPMPEALSIRLIGCQTLRQVSSFFYAAQLMTPTQLGSISRVFHRGRHLPRRSPTRFSLRRNFSALSPGGLACIGSA